MAVQCVGVCVLTFALFIMLTVAKVFDTWRRSTNILMQINGQRLLVFNMVDCFSPFASLLFTFCGNKFLQVKRKMDLVYGGGSVGLMGLISQKVFDGGCHVLG